MGAGSSATRVKVAGYKKSNPSAGGHPCSVSLTSFTSLGICWDNTN
jgi:hypothetical protein